MLLGPRGGLGGRPCRRCADRRRPPAASGPPVGCEAFAYRRMKNDERDAADLAGLARIGRLPEGWIAPRATRDVLEQVRTAASTGGCVGLKAQVHSVPGKQACRCRCRTCSAWVG